MIIEPVINLMSLYVALAIFLFLGFLGCLFLLYVQLANRILSDNFLRSRKRPLVDRSPTNFDRSTVEGRGKNWFYTNRAEFLNVQVSSFDNTKLYGYYRPSSDRDSKNVLICLHGKGEHPNMCSAYAKLFMTKIQCHVLIVHERAHEMSDGNFSSYGLYESVDLQRWIDFVKEQVGNDCRVFVYGREMGAAAALLAASQDDADECLAGIIADSAYDNLDELILKRIRNQYKFNFAFVYSWVRRNILKRFKFDTSVCDVVRSAGKIRVPVLLFAGTDDKKINPECTRRIYDNINSQKRMVLIEDAKHLQCYNMTPVLYEKEVETFIEKCCIRLVKLGRM